MTSKDYARSITVRCSPETAYNAATSEFDKWWTDPGTNLSEIGNVATFRFPPNVSTWTFKATRLEPHALVEHECVGANHIMPEKPEASRTEWLGTIMRFEIHEVEDGTQITLTHIGLQPNLECYEICEAGWDHFFMKSLKAYLDSGTGIPHE